MMSENNHRYSFGRRKFAGLGMALGLVFGGLVGILVGNPAVFAGGTMVLGLAIGAALDKRNSSNDS